MSTTTLWISITKNFGGNEFISLLLIIVYYILKSHFKNTAFVLKEKKTYKTSFQLKKKIF